MSSGRLRWTKNTRVYVSLLIIPSLFLAFGCAPKKIRVYEPPESVPELRSSIVQYAVTLLGKPYRNAAKGPDSFDCSGFVYYVYRRFDINVPNSTDALNRVGRQVSGDDIMVGDLVVFRIKREYHVGIMISKREFIHASKSRGVAVDSVEASYWRRYFSHFRSLL